MKKSTKYMNGSKRGMIYINPCQYKRIHRLYDSNINTFLMNAFIIFLLTNVNLITAIFIMLHYFSVVWLNSSVLLRFILEGKLV